MGQNPSKDVDQLITNEKYLEAVIKLVETYGPRVQNRTTVDKQKHLHPRLDLCLLALTQEANDAILIDSRFQKDHVLRLRDATLASITNESMFTRGFDYLLSDMLSGSSSLLYRHEKIDMLLQGIIALDEWVAKEIDTELKALLNEKKKKIEDLLQPLFKERNVLSLVVMGSPGAGKSTFIKYFYDKTSQEDKKNISKRAFGDVHIPESPKTGDGANAVTKCTRYYPCKIGERDVVFIDTPGFDDRGAMGTLITIQLTFEKPWSLVINGVLYVKDTSSPRKNTEDSSMMQIVRDTLGGAREVSNVPNVWDSVLIVGTKNDIFTYNLKKNENFSKKIADYGDDLTSALNKTKGIRTKQFVSVSCEKNDMESFVEKLDDLFKPESRLVYLTPSAEKMVDILRESGWDNTVTTEDYDKKFEEYQKGKRNNLIFISCSVVLVGVVVLGAGAGASSSISDASVEVLSKAAALGGRAMAKKIIEMPTSLGRIARLSIRLGNAGNEEDWDLCSLMSALSYDVKTEKEFESALRYHLGQYKMENVKYWNFRPTPDGKNFDRSYDCPILSLVMKKKLYIAWRGTQTLEDFLTDGNCRPVANSIFSKECPNIRAHSGMNAIIGSNHIFLVDYAKEIIKKYEITDVIFTGHSLGAGLAQIALMSALSQKRQSQNEEIENVEFRCKAFAAPMVFSYEDKDLEPNEKDILTEFKSCCDICIFGQDMKSAFGHKAGLGLGEIAGIAIDGKEKASSQLLARAIPLEGNDLPYEISSAVTFCMNADQEFLDKLKASPSSLSKQLKGIIGGKVGAKAASLLSFEGPTGDMAKSYKHVAMLHHITENSVSPLLTNDDLLAIPFSSNDTNVLEYHSVLPQCCGTYNIARRNKLLGLLHPELDISGGGNDK